MYGFIVPAKGLNLLTKLLTGDTLTLTRVMVGSGRLQDIADTQTITTLIHPVAAAASTIPSISGNTCSFIVEYRSDMNGGLEEGFWLNEFGVYAFDPDIGEVLIYYGMLGEYPQYVAAYDGGSVDIRRFPVTIVLTNDVHVSIDYQPIVFMSAEDVDDYFQNVALPIAVIEAQKLVNTHNVNPNAHPDIRTALIDVIARMGRLEDMMINNITGNPFLVTFGDLNGLTVSGVWNQTQQRIEF